MFINDTYVTTLDLEGVAEAGNVLAVNGYFKGDGIEGRVTRYQGLTVRSLQTAYGPVDESLFHDPEDDSIKIYRSGANTADAVIEASFLNPYATSQGSWDYGFLFRNSAFNTFHSVVVASNGSWYHNVRTETVESSKELAGERSSRINTSSNGSNHLRIIVLENNAWFFINDNFVARLDLSDLGDPGDIFAVTGFFTGDEVAGESTSFENFTVWVPE